MPSGTARTGQDYLAALADGRGVFLDGSRVDNLDTHPAFRGVVQTIAAMFDVAADEHGPLRTLERGGRRVNSALVAPHSADELAARCQAAQSWARQTLGFVSGMPDYGASFIAGFAGGAPVFDENGGAGADRVRRFHQRLLAEDLYVACAFIPPQVGRRRGDGDHDSLTQVGVVQEKDGGIVVRGAQMLATAGALADYLLVSSLRPLQPGEEQYGLTFVVPLSAPGLKLSCRRSFAAGVPGDFDYPLTSRFDESDALVAFHDVFIPWEDVFVYRDIDLVERQWRETAAYALGMHQAQSRLATQAMFLLGLASVVVDTKGLHANAVVQERLGQLAALATSVQSLVASAESQAGADSFGVWRPASQFVDAALALQPDIQLRMVSLLRELMGATALQTPASYLDLLSPDTRDMIQGFVGPPDEPRADRVKIFKLAWDAVGSEFASRHQQYELTYVGSPAVRRVAMYRRFNYEPARRMVTDFLNTYRLPQP